MSWNKLHHEKWTWRITPTLPFSSYLFSHLELQVNQPENTCYRITQYCLLFLKTSMSLYVFSSALFILSVGRSPRVSPEHCPVSSHDNAGRRRKSETTIKLINKSNTWYTSCCGQYDPKHQYQFSAGSHTLSCTIKQPKKRIICIMCILKWLNDSCPSVNVIPFFYALQNTFQFQTPLSLQVLLYAIVSHILDFSEQTYYKHMQKWWFWSLIETHQASKVLLTYITAK